MHTGNTADVLAAIPGQSPSHDGAKVGSIHSIDELGAVFVDFAGNTVGPIRAAIAAHVAADFQTSEELLTRRVVLVFEDNDLRRPVVVGLVVDSLEEARRSSPAGDLLAELVVDGHSMRIGAKEELSLSCGKSQITLQRNGKLVLRGTDIVSRSSGQNRLRGATVKIN